MIDRDPELRYSKNSIKVIHITFNMGIGGTEQVIRQLVSGLPAEKFMNTILCIDGHIGEIGEQVQSQGVSVTSIKRLPGLDWKLVREVRKIIRNTDADIIHCHQYTPWVYGWLGSLGTDAKVVFTEHGRFHPDKFRLKAMVINPLMAFTTNAIVAISAATRHALSRYEFIPRPLIRVIYNGIHELEYNNDDAISVRQNLGIPVGAFVFGTVARLDPVKNQEMMLKAFSVAVKQHSDFWLLLVGDGPDREKLQEKAKGLGIDKRVIFTGFQQYPANYLTAMDVFLLTSHTEGTSMTLLEAMSLGVPAIVTAVGGNPEIVSHGKTGFLVPTNKHELLAESMIELYADPEKVRSMAIHCKKIFRSRFSIAPMISSYQTLYDQVLQG